jgi:hypothetical protein
VVHYATKRVRPEQSLTVTEIRNTDAATKAEYLKVADRVLRFIQPMHNWYPDITKIERVVNTALEANFEAAKRNAFTQSTDYKFHGTSEGASRASARTASASPRLQSVERGPFCSAGVSTSPRSRPRVHRTSTPRAATSSCSARWV